MKTLDEAKLRSEFDEMELKHWSSRLSEFVNVPLSCKKQVADYWIEKMKQRDLAMLEEVEKLKYKDKSQQCNCCGWDNAIDRVLSTLSNYKERLNK